MRSKGPMPNASLSIKCKGGAHNVPGVKHTGQPPKKGPGDCVSDACRPEKSWGQNPVNPHPFVFGRKFGCLKIGETSKQLGSPLHQAQTRVPCKISSGDIPNRHAVLCCGTFVEPWWKPPWTTPEPIWAETPKLSAVGDKNRNPFGCGSKLDRKGYAGFGPCFHLPGQHFGAGFWSHSHLGPAG